MKDYEGVFIVKANLTDEASQKLVTLIEAEVSKKGGKVENVEKWGRKTLAYPITKEKEAVYYKLNFKVAPQDMPDLRKIYRLNEGILRFMILKKD